MSLSANLIETIKKMYNCRMTAIEYEKRTGDSKNSIALFYDECLGFIEQIFSGRDIDKIESSLTPVVKDTCFLNWIIGKAESGYNQAYMDRAMSDIKKVNGASPLQQYVIQQLINILNEENYKLPDAVYDYRNRNHVFLMKVHFHKMLHKFHVVMRKTPDCVLCVLIDEYNRIASKYNRPFNRDDFFGNNALIIYNMFENNALENSFHDVVMIIKLLEKIMNIYVTVRIIAQEAQPIIAPVIAHIATPVVQKVTKNKVFTIDELCDYKVDKLKKLCVENNIVMKSNARRADYEKALLALK